MLYQMTKIIYVHYKNSIKLQNIIQTLEEKSPRKSSPGIVI